MRGSGLPFLLRDPENSCNNEDGGRSADCW